MSAVNFPGDFFFFFVGGEMEMGLHHISVHSYKMNTGHSPGLKVLFGKLSQWHHPVSILVALVFFLFSRSFSSPSATPDCPHRYADERIFRFN